jgi:hypothetical protein
MLTSMKKLILGLVLSIFVTKVNADVLEAKPLKDLMETIQQTEFNYTETDKSFGYDTTKSCLYTAADMLVLKNYCFPKKEYPAKGYTIISPKFGIVELYQENMTPTVQKRDIHYMVFSTDLRSYVKNGVSGLKIADTNKILEYFNRTQPGSCWSTNFSYYTQMPEAACNQRASDVVGFDTWAKETQLMSTDDFLWKTMMSELEEKFKE